MTAALLQRHRSACVLGHFLLSSEFCCLSPPVSPLSFSSFLRSDRIGGAPSYSFTPAFPVHPLRFRFRLLSLSFDRLLSCAYCAASSPSPPLPVTPPASASRTAVCQFVPSGVSSFASVPYRSVPPFRFRLPFVSVCVLLHIPIVLLPRVASSDRFALHCTPYHSPAAGTANAVLRFGRMSACVFRRNFVCSHVPLPRSADIRVAVPRATRTAARRSPLPRAVQSFEFSK